ncbi:hypothetical protein [Candidatus Poriferisodalis sp.]|uniref:hypothetical protein n=1 Tax=Candidatus Poriferisodalis sp. TaxID=3101277 RepID=UPI003B52579C
MSRQAFYDWRRGCAAGSTPRDADLAGIGEIHAASGGAAPRGSCPFPTAAANTSRASSAPASPVEDRPSWRAVRCLADNAVAEAFFSGLKRELVHRHRYPDRATARRSIFERLARHNAHRRHTSHDGRTADEHGSVRHIPSDQPVLTN